MGFFLTAPEWVETDIFFPKILKLHLNYFSFVCMYGISFISFSFKPELKCPGLQSGTVFSLSSAPLPLSHSGLPAGVATVPIVAVDLSHQCFFVFL